MKEVQQNSTKYTTKKEELFSDLFDKYYVRLCHYANTFITDFDVCKDIAQELFVKLWEIEIENFSKEELDGYMYRGIKNGCIDFLRKAKVRQNSRAVILQKLLDNNIDVFVPEIELKELSIKIDQALKQLPERTLLMFNMSRQKNKSYSEIAEDMNISVKGVEFHMSKALNILRGELKEYLPVIIFLSGFFENN